MATKTGSRSKTSGPTRVSARIMDGIQKLPHGVTGLVLLAVWLFLSNALILTGYRVAQES